MATNEINYSENSVVDLSGDTVNSEVLEEGYTAHDATGTSITGSSTAVHYGKAQSLTEDQKAQARDNIGALPASGTAVDSAKLGGKAAEYYIQPINLLDNSDFTNPVNQRGYTSGTELAAYTYHLDRWRTYNTGGALTLDTNGISTGSVWVQQLLEKKQLTGKTLTLAVECSDGSLAVESGTLPSGSEWTNFINSTQNGISIIATNSAENQFFVRFTSGDKYVIWACLYEGTYTAETLPPYVPKGYVTELMECQRRCVPMYGSARYRASRVLADYLYFEIPFPVIMAKTPEISNTKSTIGVGSITGNATKDYTFGVSNMNATSVQIRAEKEGHGLTDAYLVFEGTTSKDGAFLLAEL